MYRYGTVQAPLLDRRRLGGRTRFEKRVASIKASMLRQEKPPRLALTLRARHGTCGCAAARPHTPLVRAQTTRAGGARGAHAHTPLV